MTSRLSTPSQSKVTGIGEVSAGHDSFWTAFVTASSRVGRLTRYNSGSFAVQIAGEIDVNDAEKLIPTKKLKTAAHVSKLALLAATATEADAGLAIGLASCGICVGTAIGGWTDGEQQYSALLEKGARRINPFIVTGTGNHAPGTELGHVVGANGPNFTFSSGCPSGLQAIAHGSLLVASGEVELCLAGGTESPLSPMVMAALARTHELSVRNDDPTRASRPFDKGHDGMVLSEGACFLMLENADHARERNAEVYAEILGGASSCDAAGLYGFDPSGETAARTIRRLLERCQVSPNEIDYVCAHANSSPVFDRKETIVLQRAFGEFAAKIPVSSIKGVLGHPFGASGAFQTAASALVMKHGLIPPTANLEDPDPECDLNLVMGEPLKKEVRHALVTSYGYGGVNSFLLLRNPNL